MNRHHNFNIVYTSNNRQTPTFTFLTYTYDFMQYMLYTSIKHVAP